ncbi:hypothetical protein [Paenibacillus sp. NPDC058071]|uniref:hypothetical protein n=1 Tax=Paenibacillus sp. NPDC058071 TaxID=3346326 RepID=UPI0036D9EB6D
MKRKYIFIVIPMSEIKKTVMLDFIASTAVFHMVKFSMHSYAAAMAGSMLLPAIVRQSLKYTHRIQQLPLLSRNTIRIVKRKSEGSAHHAIPISSTPFALPEAGERREEQSWLPSIRP